jgi:hypothetical protein
MARDFDEMAYTERILAEESLVLERRPRRNVDARFDLLDKRLASYSMWLVHLASLLAQVERSSSAHDIAVVANLVQQLRVTTRGETAGDMAVPTTSALKTPFNLTHSSSNSSSREVCNTHFSDSLVISHSFPSSFRI